jgi:hypothetical protein
LRPSTRKLPCRRPILIATPMHRSLTWCTSFSQLSFKVVWIVKAAIPMNRSQAAHPEFLGRFFPYYGLRKTRKSVGCPHLAVSKAVSAAPRNGSHSWQMRPARSASQNGSSPWVAHRPQGPIAFFGRALIDTLIGSSGYGGFSSRFCGLGKIGMRVAEVCNHPPASEGKSPERCLPVATPCSGSSRLRVVDYLGGSAVRWNIDFFQMRALFGLGMDAGEFAKHFYGHKIAFYLFFLVN